LNYFKFIFKLKTKTFEGHNSSVLKFYFINNGNQIVSCASDGLIKLWFVKTNECIETFDQHDDKLWALSVSKDEKKFLSGGSDGKINLWYDQTEEVNSNKLEEEKTIILQ
jgi:U3 small nucleolar RNA-associated protein 13